MDNFQPVPGNQNQTEQLSFATIQHNLNDILPRTSEIGYLWSAYLAESMSVCFLKTYVAHSKDPDFKLVLQRALDVSSQRVTSMEEIFRSIQHPIPVGFGDTDVDITAKQLFNESFTVLYTRLMNKFVLQYYCNALTDSTRSDFRSFFSECIKTSHEIHQKATDVLLAKGLLQKFPNIVIPDRVDYVQDTDYFGTFFGKKRPLNALEISNIFSLMETKLLIRTLNLGYSQTVKSEKIKKYMSKLNQVADKQLKVLGSLLSDEDIPQPQILDTLVTESMESGISEKLILNHITAVTAYIITGYGLAVARTTRRDLITTFRAFVTDLLLLAHDGGELLIESGWMERIPETTDRKELIQ